MPVPLPFFERLWFMDAMKLAKRLMELGQADKALEGFELALRTQKNLSAQEKLQAALLVLQLEGDYKLAYRALLELNRAGDYVEESAAVMTEAFYQPNEAALRSQYEKNCKSLRKYKYIFRKDFLPYEMLPVKFYPFDDKTYVPYVSGKFRSITDYSEPVVTQNFFHDLENPILAEDVYSQYELEYLNDNVRPSEWVSRENHIYLHYSDWALFCAHLQVLNFPKLLASQKLVFLIEEEIERYPIDFKEEFGIDYSCFPLKPFSLREVNRLIWHTQLSYHNGGDFFNEVLDGHPNLICSSSIMNDSIMRVIDEIRTALDSAESWHEVSEIFDKRDWPNVDMVYDLYRLKDRTDKDILVAYLCRDVERIHTLDAAARIVPAILYQPHFGYIATSFSVDSQGKAVMNSVQLEEIRHSPIFANFKYIKSFTPLRRFTTSYAATMKFMANPSDILPSRRQGVIHDELLSRVIFRGFMVDRQERVWKDAAVVRFEDAKLNPLATFTALARFLDIPVTPSMHQSTFNGQPLDRPDAGFYTGPVFQTYDSYANQAERCFLEFFLRDAYQYYCYDFHYYDGSPMDEKCVNELISHFGTLDHYMKETMRRKCYASAQLACDQAGGERVITDAQVLTPEEQADKETEKYMVAVAEQRAFVSRILLQGLRFLNDDGLPLQFLPMLKPDPELLVQPVYH